MLLIRAIVFALLFLTAIGFIELSATLFGSSHDRVAIGVALSLSIWLVTMHVTKPPTE